MSGQTGTTKKETVTLREFGDYLSVQCVLAREIAREKGVLLTHFKWYARTPKPIIHCSICRQDWYECGHRSFDSPVFDRQSLIEAVQSYFSCRPTQVDRMQGITEARIRAWLGLDSENT